MSFDYESGRGRRLKILIALTLFIIASGIYLNSSGPGMTGFVTFENSSTIALYDSFSVNSTISLGLPDNLTSVSVSGEFIGDGTARAYLEYSSGRILIIDTSAINATGNTRNSITGYVVGDADTNSENITADNETVNNTINSSENISENAAQNTTDNIIDNNTTDNTDNNTDNATNNITQETSQNITNNITNNISEEAIVGITANISTPDISGNITENTTGNIAENATANITSNNTNNSVQPNILEILTRFSSYCRDSCQVDHISGPYSLSIEIEGNVTLTIDSLAYSYDVIQPIENLTVNETANYTLSEDVITKGKLEKKFKGLLIDKVNKRTWKDNRTEFDIDISEKKSGNRISLKGVKNIDELQDIVFIPFKQHRQASIATDIIYVNSLNMTNATLRVVKSGAVSAIARCDNYDVASNSCESWTTTGIPFVDYGDYIEFTVDHFTGYGGFYTAQRYYVSSATSPTLPGLVNLNTSQTGNIHFINQTGLAATTQYVFLNASILNVSPATITTSDIVNFSAYWITGSRLTYGNITYKLYKNNSEGSTLICQSGNGTTLGTTIAASKSALFLGDCSPSSDVTLTSNDGLIYQIILYVFSVGSPGANRWATLYWDTATFSTWVNYTSISTPDINVTTDQATYAPSQNINLSGYFYWSNGSGVGGNNVTVNVFNSTNRMIYSVNVTSSASGYYSANYTLGPNPDLGTWSANVTGIYNSTVNATNLTSFTVSMPLRIIYVQTSSSTPLENSNKTVNFNFTIDDTQGNNKINTSTISIKINRSGVTRVMVSCTSSVYSASALNASCNVSLPYYDFAGVWTVNISVNDTSGTYAENISNTFTYNELSALQISTNMLSIGTVAPGQANIASGPIIINNTGNVNFTNISLKAYSLINLSSTINATNFTANRTNSSLGAKLLNNSFITIPAARLNTTTDSVIANETIYVYLNVPYPLMTGYYLSSQSWMLLAER